MMSGISKYALDADKTNQAIALLGGVTAQSYSVVGLHNSPSDAVLPLVDVSAVVFMQSEQATQNLTEQNTNTLEKPLLNLTSQEVLPRLLSVANGDDAVADLPGEFLSRSFQNPEMMSRFNASDVDGQGASVVQQSGVSGVSGSEISAETMGLNNGFSLLDFIGQTFAQEEVPQEDLDASFDGRRQAEFRELLVDSSRELGADVREFSQDNVDGTGRETLSDILAAVGTDELNSTASPLLSVDYYSKSAELINGLIEFAAQPIGSVSLVQVGPFYQEFRQDVTAYFG